LAEPLADDVRLRYAQVSGVPLDSRFLAAQEAAGGSKGAVERKKIDGPCPICFEDMDDPVEAASGKANGPAVLLKRSPGAPRPVATMSMPPVLSNGRNLARKLQLARIADARGQRGGEGNLEE